MPRFGRTEVLRYRRRACPAVAPRRVGGQKKTRRLLSVGGLLNFVNAAYASSTHTPPTRLVPVFGTRFRPFDTLRVVVGFVVQANIARSIAAARGTVKTR